MATHEADRMVDTEGSATVQAQETVPRESSPSTGLDARPVARPSMPRPLTLIFRSLCAFALLVPVSLIASSPVAAVHTIAPTTTCQNDYLTDVDGLGVICEVTVVNTITATGGSATVTVHECNGPAGAATTCSTDTTVLAAPVTAITQCDGSVNGGGSTFVCSVVVTNNFVGVSPGSTGVTVNECIGSGGGGGTAMTCDPLSSTTSAAITQCNGSSSGGGGSMTCTATGTMASALVVTINQCNGTANGGGDAVVCTATITNNAMPAPTPEPAATPTAPAAVPTALAAVPTALAAVPTALAAVPTQARAATPPPTNAGSGGSGNNSSPLFPLMILLALGGLGLAAVVTQRRSARS